MAKILFTHVRLMANAFDSDHQFMFGREYTFYDNGKGTTYDKFGDKHVQVDDWRWRVEGGRLQMLRASDAHWHFAIKELHDAYKQHVLSVITEEASNG